MSKSKVTKGANCIYVPMVNGEYSTLYQDLSSKLKERPLVNLIYSSYLVPGVQDAMDNAGFKRNEQDQHSVDDVYTFLDVEQMLRDQEVNLNTASRGLGIINSAGQPVDFTMEEAYRRAQDINNNSKGRVAFVVQHDTKFNVILENKDSRTQIRKGEVEQQMETWKVLNDEFTRLGIDVSFLINKFPDLINPLRVQEFLSYFNSLYRVSNKDLSERDIAVLMAMNISYPTVRNLLNRGWGNFDETVKKTYDVVQNPKNYSQSIVNFVNDTLLDTRRLLRQDMINLSNHIRLDVVKDFQKSSQEFKTKSVLDSLHKRYGIDSEVIIRTSEEIRTLSEANADAIIALHRQLKVLKNRQGNTAQAIEIEKTLDNITKELAGKKYSAGMLSFMQQATKYGNIVDKLLLNINQSGTALEYVRARSDAYVTARNFREIYYPIIKALANLDNLIVDESVSTEDRENLKNTAKKLLEYFDRHENMMNDLKRETMIDMCREIFGDTAADGKPIAVFVQMAQEDSSLMDYLYSMSRVSNPLIAAMGTIIRDAQTDRDAQLTIFSERIRKANADLDGSSEFMYEFIDNQYYIKSPYDWKKFNNARRTAEHEYRRNEGLSGFALKDAMDKWDEKNTQSVEVDAVNHRFERVPSNAYLKKVNPLDSFTDKQRAYYDTMMQIKGELGTLLPAYAQKQFLPPQKRASWDDIVRRGIKGQMSAKEVAKNLLDRMNPIKIREDDTRFRRNSINVDGESYWDASGAYDNTLLKRIPIYYMNKLKNQNDLIMDFSSAIASFAATALNYDAMDNIKNTIELMSDYVSDQPIAHKSGDNNLADIVKTNSVAIARALKIKSEGSRTQGLLEGFVEQHLYGITMKDTNTAARILQALVNYTSMRQLTVNVKGAMSNALVGEAQMLIEAIAGTASQLAKRDVMYNIKNYAVAHAILVGDKFKPGVWSDHLTGNRTSKAILLEELFDPMQEVYEDLGNRRFSTFARLFGGINTMAMYSVGESLIHIVNMYAMLDHAKVMLDGKKISVYQALEVSEPESKNAHLRFRDGVTDLEGNALTLDSDFIKQLKKDIRYVNQQTHGAMNVEDKGLIQRRIAGRAVMNFRQWMVEHYSRRYRGRHWDGTIMDWTEGYWTTMGKFLKSYISDYLKFVSDADAHWNELDENQKNNIFRCLSEVMILATLVTLSHALGEPADHKKEWWYRMWIYQVKRLILDETASVPWGMPQEAKTIIQSPVASINTVNAILYPFIGLTNGDVHDTLKSGRYKGWNKYYRNLLKYTVPFYGQIDQLAHMDEEDYIYSMFGQQRNY